MLGRPFAIAFVALTVGACGVNELDQYRETIHTTRIQTQIASDVELDIVDAPIVANSPNDPNAAAVAASESYILTSLRSRLDRFVTPDRIATVFDDVFANDVSRGTGWALAGSGATYDARFLATVSGFGLSVDAYGHASLYFRMHLRGWYEPTGRLIYEDWSSNTAELPIFGPYGSGPAYFGDDPDAIAAERAYNLLVLNDVSGSDLREMVLDAAEDAAAKLARELVQDSLR